MTKNRKPTLLDKRLVDRYVSRGMLKRTEVDKALNALPDVGPQSENIADRVYRNVDGAESVESDA